MAKKQLTLKHIERENKKFEKKEKIDLDDDFFVYIYPNFSPKKIQEMIVEMISDTEQAKELGLEEEFNQIRYSDWGFFHMIKYFADLDIPSDFKEKLSAYFTLVESEFYKTILSAFPKESIEKVGQAMENVANLFDEFAQMDDETKAKVINSFLKSEGIEAVVKE